MKDFLKFINESEEKKVKVTDFDKIFNENTYPYADLDDERFQKNIISNPNTKVRELYEKIEEVIVDIGHLTDMGEVIEESKLDYGEILLVLEELKYVWMRLNELNPKKY